MLNFIIRTADGERLVEIPGTWQDVSAECYSRIYGKTGTALFAELLEVPEDALRALPSIELDVISDAVGFLDDDLESVIPDELASVNVGAKSIGQIEKAFSILNEFPIWDAAPYVFAIYSVNPYDETAAFAMAAELQNQPIEKIFAGSVFLINQINEFYGKYLPMLSKEPDENEIAAGVDRFAKYGFFATLVSKCGGNPLIYDEMMKVSADVFYLTLLFEHEQSEYQTELNKLKSITNAPE